MVASAQGDKDASPRQMTPLNDLLGDDPLADVVRARQTTIDTLSKDGEFDRTRPSMGIAFAGQLLPGEGRATSSGQDATLPDDCLESGHVVVHGAFTVEQRNGVFDPDVEVGDDALLQDRSLADTGREPSP